MIVTINYRAIKWDNHQGGSGMPFQDKVVHEIIQDATLIETKVEVSEILSALMINTYVGEVELINIELN